MRDWASSESIKTLPYLVRGALRWLHLPLDGTLHSMPIVPLTIADGKSPIHLMLALRSSP